MTKLRYSHADAVENRLLYNQQVLLQPSFEFEKACTTSKLCIVITWTTVVDQGINSLRFLSSCCVLRNFHPYYIEACCSETLNENTKVSAFSTKSPNVSIHILHFFVLYRLLMENLRNLRARGKEFCNFIIHIFPWVPIPCALYSLRCMPWEFYVLLLHLYFFLAAFK